MPDRLEIGEKQMELYREQQKAREAARNAANDHRLARLVTLGEDAKPRRGEAAEMYRARADAILARVRGAAPQEAAKAEPKVAAGAGAVPEEADVPMQKPEPHPVGVVDGLPIKRETFELGTRKENTTDDEKFDQNRLDRDDTDVLKDVRMSSGDHWLGDSLNVEDEARADTFRLRDEATIVGGVPVASGHWNHYQLVVDTMPTQADMDAILDQHGNPAGMNQPGVGIVFVRAQSVAGQATGGPNDPGVKGNIWLTGNDNVVIHGVEHGVDIETRGDIEIRAQGNMWLVPTISYTGHLYVWDSGSSGYGQGFKKAVTGVWSDIKDRTDIYVLHGIIVEQLVPAEATSPPFGEMITHH